MISRVLRCRLEKKHVLSRCGGPLSYCFWLSVILIHAAAGKPLQLPTARSLKKAGHAAAGKCVQVPAAPCLIECVLRVLPCSPVISFGLWVFWHFGFCVFWSLGLWVFWSVGLLVFALTLPCCCFALALLSLCFFKMDSHAPDKNKLNFVN